MAAFLNVFIHILYIFRTEQLVGGSSPASPNRDGSESFQHMEAYRCSTKNPKGSGQRQLTINTGNLPPQKSKIQRRRLDQAAGDEINRQPLSTVDGLFAWRHDFKMDP